MNAIFMNSKNSKISDPYRLLLNLTVKKDLKEKINRLLYQILAFTIHRKMLKSDIKTINLKSQLQHGIKNLNFRKIMFYIKKFEYI